MFYFLFLQLTIPFQTLLIVVDCLDASVSELLKLLIPKKFLRSSEIYLKLLGKLRFILHRREGFGFRQSANGRLNSLAIWVFLTHFG